MPCYDKAKGCAWTCKKMFDEIGSKICPACDKKVKEKQPFLTIQYFEKERLIHRECYKTWDKL